MVLSLIPTLSNLSTGDMTTHAETNVLLACCHVQRVRTILTAEIGWESMKATAEWL